MKVLVLNCGSSSVKFQLLEMIDETPLAKGIVEKIGKKDAILTYKPAGGVKHQEVREVPDHTVAIELMLRLLVDPEQGVIDNLERIESVGHRVVHGGERITESVLIDDEVIRCIESCTAFAPLHNPNNLKGIRACQKLLPHAPQVAVFDTAFHATIPPKAYLYALPYELYEELGIRRYGFHGTSHKYVSHRAGEILNRPLSELKLITCHLGNGASITAVDGGKSVDTSMGFTPLEGLVMGTRCGDLDPALVPYMMKRLDLSSEEMDAMMNKKSGMLGLTGTSNDMREIEAEADKGSVRHRQALEIYCNRVKKYVGAYAAEMGGVDAVVFTGGIGENSRFVRARSLENLQRFGVEIEPAKNEANETFINSGPVAVMVVPTNEELAIARDTRRIVSG